MIKMKHCLFEYTPEGCRTHFGERTVEAHPHHTPHYHVIAHRCGYGDDVLAYCREHEFCHNFMEQELHDRASRVIKSLAFDRMPTGPDAAYEEIAAQTMQRWLRANERPIVSGVNWDQLRQLALTYLSYL